MIPKVLIVDDEPNILLSLDFLMKKNGYKVHLARNGAEALESAFNLLPNVIILDIMMPDIDGYEICKIIKSDPVFLNTKILFLSAKSKESDIAKGLEMGADAYMTKPFGNKNLLEKVRELVQS